ncbi:uncharacterized protein [Cicer arietinum]|uniref:Uncharacterized protein LOC113784078 n=1 Tax=Cicer arietinum TaxID=3827 RepID=A0A3Q7Y6E6_CICAR|nr:uncharacterized protein LOC113784078 [Cicer arietinum]
MSVVSKPFNEFSKQTTQSNPSTSFKPFAINTVQTLSYQRRSQTNPSSQSTPFAINQRRLPFALDRHFKSQAEELGRDPTLDEVFLKTHTKKKDNSWVDERAKKTYETFQGKLQQASKGGEASSSCSQVVNVEARLDMWVQFVGGKNKGRIYGAGDRSSLYRPGVASLVPDYHPSRGCANFLSQQSNEIAAQIAAFEERAKATEHEAREELRKVEQRRQEEVQQTKQRTTELQMQLAILAKSVASIQAESSRRRRHLDYDEDESNDDDGEE